MASIDFTLCNVCAEDFVQLVGNVSSFFFWEKFYSMTFGRLSKHSTKYKYYSSIDLIKKVNSWCECHYLDSIRFSDMRETLKNRICVLNRYKKTHFDLSNILNEKYPEYEIIRDYKLYCKKEGKEALFCFEGTNHHMNKYFKQLQKALSSALNKLDRFWGFDGVVGYGLDYGLSHDEMDLFNLQIHRKLNIALSCLKEIAIETQNKKCVETLKLITNLDTQ